MTAEMTNLIDQWEEQLASLEEDIALLHVCISTSSLFAISFKIETEADSCTSTFIINFDHRQL